MESKRTAMRLLAAQGSWKRKASLIGPHRNAQENSPKNIKLALSSAHSSEHTGNSVVFRYCSDVLFGVPFRREVENNGIRQTGDEKLSILAWHKELSRQHSS